MNTQTKLGTALLKRLLAIREEKGTITIEDVGTMLQGMAENLEANTQPDAFLRQEFQKMANHITDAKTEVLAMIPEEASHKSIGNAGKQLDAVVKATEEATTGIMDAADEIQSLIKDIDKATKDKIEAAIVRIYDACNFQDLTGQRITKVVGCLEYLDSKINRLLSHFSGKPMIEGEQPIARNDNHLLSGPALPGNGPTQAEIDALFAGLK